MYVQYKLNVSENQVDTLKDAIRLKKGELSVFQKVVMSCCLHQHKPIDWTRHKWKGNVYKFVYELDKWQRMQAMLEVLLCHLFVLYPLLLMH